MHCKSEAKFREYNKQNNCPMSSGRVLVLQCAGILLRLYLFAVGVSF